jgi:hypothetical protein
MHLTHEEKLVLYVAGVYYASHGAPGLDDQDNAKELNEALISILNKLEKEVT